MSRKTPRPTRTALVVTVFLLVVGVGSALAARGEPKRELTAADNARARAMLLRKSDLASGFVASPSSSEEGDTYCKAIDESGLTVTGEAESPNFVRSVIYVTSAAQVYESAADARASWRQGTSAAGERCARDILKREFAKQGIELKSYRRVSFPTVVVSSAAYRVELSRESQGVTVPLVIDFVALIRSRAQVAVFSSGLTEVPRAERLRLVRLVVKRMTKAMRGA